MASSSLTRDQTGAPCVENTVLATGPLGKPSSILYLGWCYFSPFVLFFIVYTVDNECSSLPPSTGAFFPKSTSLRYHFLFLLFIYHKMQISSESLHEFWQIYTTSQDIGHFITLQSPFPVSSSNPSSGSYSTAFCLFIILDVFFLVSCR